jgi:predicted nucleic acid-binding protein
VTRPCVVDASVALKWVLDEEDSLLARRLLGADFELYAPDLLLIEVANGLWRHSRRGDTSRIVADAMIGRLQSLVPNLIETSVMVQRALQLAHELDHPVYDCIYMALGERLDLPVVTADQRFFRRAAPIARNGRIVMLAEWPS